MKKIVIMFFILCSLTSYSGEIWAKIGRNTEGDFTLTDTDYNSDASTIGTLEYVLDLNESFKVGLETGLSFFNINSKEYVDYIPVGANLKFIQPYGDMSVSFFASAGYNIPYVTTTYTSQDIKEVTLSGYFGLGAALIWDQFLFEVSYSFNFADIKADIRQEDNSILEQTESTFINHLTFKFGYRFY